MLAPSASERHVRPAQVCDSTGGAPGGLHQPKARQASVSSAYAASASSVLAVESFQTVLPGLWTWARCNSFYKPVEASRPRGDRNIDSSGRVWKAERAERAETCSEAREAHVNRSDLPPSPRSPPSPPYL